MAIKVKKRTTKREDAKAPDQIYTTTERIFNYIEKQKKHFLIGLTALLLVIIVVTALTGQAKRHRNEAGAQVTEAVVLLSAPVTDTPLPDTLLPTFPTEAARYNAIEETISERISDEDAPPALHAVAAASSMYRGELAEAQTHYQEMSLSSGLLISQFGNIGAAALQAETGNLEAARASIEQVSVSFPSLALFSRFQLASLTEAAGDLAGAQQQYQQIVSEYGGPFAALSDNNPMSQVVGVVEHRAQLLAVVLGQFEEEPAQESPTPGNTPSEEAVGSEHTDGQ